MDIFSSEVRHRIMSRIRSRDTSPEKAIRRELHRAGFRYRVCDKKYPGKPDIILPHFYCVIFVNGCFWHAHENCRHFVFPKSNQDYWRNKFIRNKERDAENIKYYQDKCWRVCFVWECAISGKDRRKSLELAKEQIIQWLEDPSEPFLEIRGF